MVKEVDNFGLKNGGILQLGRRLGSNPGNSGVSPAHQKGSSAADGAALPAVQLDRLQLLGDCVVVIAETGKTVKSLAAQMEVIQNCLWCYFLLPILPAFLLSDLFLASQFPTYWL